MARLRRVMAVAVAATLGTVRLASPLGAQQSNPGRPTPTDSVTIDTTAAQGPAFFTIRASDGEHMDAGSFPALQRHISLTLIGVPLGMAVEAIADRANLETTFSNEIIPLGARVSMHGDDITVAAALRWVLVNARVDVLLQNENHLTLVPRTSPAANDSSGVLTGELLDGTTGEPVPYGTVTLLGTELARFANDGGHFRIARLPARRYVIRARQIGYAPVDSTVGVARDSTTRLTIRMHRIPAMLRIVRVTGHNKNGCVATGIPDSTVDPTLAALFTQIRENVDRYHLLLEAYPFRDTHVERQARRFPKGGDFVEFVDTIAYESRGHRPYHVGGLLYDELLMRQDSVFRDRSVPGGTVRVFVGMRTRVAERRRKMNLPTFADLVDPAFVAAHCFEYGGTSGGDDSLGLIRVNFQPAKRIKAPDVSGSVYLDADSLILRRAVFELTNPKAAKPRVFGVAVTTTFREILPLVPIVASFQSVQPLGLGLTAVGTDRMIGFEFEGLAPGEQPPASSERTSTASALRAEPAVPSPATSLVGDPGDTRIRAVFPADASCKPTPAVDTLSLILYGTLHGQRPPLLPDTTWSAYTSSVLSAFSQTFVLPDTLALSSFSWPFEHAVRKDASVPERAGAGLDAGARLPPVVPPIDRSKPRSGALTVVLVDDAGDPVPFAAVRLVGAPDDLRTESTGIARIPRLYPGTYVVQVRRIGYTAADTTIVVSAGPAMTTDTIRTSRVATRLAIVNVRGRNVGPFVVPLISTTVTLTLAADGSLGHASLIASSTSDTIDSLVLAAVRRAATAHAFPRLEGPRTDRDSVTVDLVVSMAEPEPGDQVVALRRVEAPAWPSVSGAYLAEMPPLPIDLLKSFSSHRPAGDTLSLEFVVSDTGRALPATAQVEYSETYPTFADKRARSARRLVPMLSTFLYEPGRIAGCRVPEFIRQGIGYQPQ